MVRERRTGKAYCSKWYDVSPDRVYDWWLSLPEGRMHIVKCSGAVERLNTREECELMEVFMEELYNPTDEYWRHTAQRLLEMINDREW